MDKKRKQLNVRLYTEDEANLKRLADYYLLNYSNIVRLLLAQKANEIQRRLESQHRAAVEFNEHVEAILEQESENE